MTKIVRILFRVNTIYVVNSYHIYLTSCQNNISFESLHIICNQTTCRTEYLTMIESLHFVQSHFLVTYTFQDSFQQRIFFISCRHLQMLVPRINTRGAVSLRALFTGAYSSTTGIPSGKPRSLRIVKCVTV